MKNGRGCSVTARATFLEKHKAQKRVMRAVAGMSASDVRDVLLEVVDAVEKAEGEPSVLDRFREANPRPDPPPVRACEGTIPKTGEPCGIYAGHTGEHRS